jgi:type VI protein secretion system component VasK
VLISGTLGRRGSPLEALFRAVWHEAGGEDRSRSHLNQLRVATEFGAIIQFVEQGRMAEIAELFAGLNVALASLDADAELGRRRLMDVQARAASIATLNQAPRLVVQIIEDVLAQTAATHEAGRPRAALAWQRDMAGPCRYALDGRYPFADGPDADLDAVAALIGPNGALARFFAIELAPIVDTSETPWRWKPEARLSGFAPDSAAFFERAAAVGDALFPPDGPVALTLTALAQRGAATVSLGGTAVPVVTSGDPGALSWPGPEPARGLAVAFATDAGPETRDWAGPWGLLHFLDGLRLRARDDGQRFLLDVRLARTRAYLELAFARPANPAAARALIASLACPPAL